MSAASPISSAGKPKLCFTLLNHWSYTGIGWNLGLESCAQSITDSLDMADYAPSVKTGINLDALTYELVAEHYPHVNRRLQRYLAAGQVEVHFELPQRDLTAFVIPAGFDADGLLGRVLVQRCL